MGLGKLRVGFGQGLEQTAYRHAIGISRESIDQLQQGITSAWSLGGEITPETAPQFLALDNVKVCGGSWLTPADAVAAKDWARITRLAQEAGKLR